MKFLNAGDSAIIIELGNEISPLINSKLKKITKYIDSLKNPFIKDLLPTYRSVIVYFDPLNLSFDQLKQMIEDNCDVNYETLEDEKKEIVEIPVLYGGEYGPDIENIATHNHLSLKK